MAVNRFARRKRRGPTLETLHMIEEAIRRSDRPLSLSEIKARLPRMVMHAALREAIEHYKRLGLVSEGSEGVTWTARPAGPAGEIEGMDLETLPTFEDDDPRASLRHDEHLYG